MARKIKSNPDSADLIGTIDDYVYSSAGAIDLVYERREKGKNDIAAIERIKESLSKKGESVPEKVTMSLAEEKLNLIELDRQIAIYTRTMLRIIADKVKRIEASPLSRLRSAEIRSIKSNMLKIKNMKRGEDVRDLMSETMGSVITLEKELGVASRIRPEGVLSRTEKKMGKMAEYWKQSAERWRAIRKHSVKHPIFFLPGSEVATDEYGFGKVLEYDGRRVLVLLDDGREKRLGMTEVIPGDVAWVDSQFASINKKIKRGDEITKSDLERIVRRMKRIHDRTKSRKKLKTYAESKRALNALVGKIQTRLTGDKLSKKELEALLLELESFQRRISASDKSSWDKADQRQWANDVSKVRKSLIKLRRKPNPCVGFHFHGKDADELLKAIESSSARQMKTAKDPDNTKKIPKSNPKKTPKKKNSKKPQWKAMCDKCEKLWDHYCERPSKVRLKKVMDHLDKMKTSTSNRVKEERAQCLRVATKEARRLGMK